ncbi:MAG: xanthine dehydrogenase family protein molybdopterin-binding subunit, partial [Gemmatimonadetes bacterium]|nr:xanthine dehydrogenase family protein molybdopterin-binding subunit [Gemmatimonadota bacterium]MYK66182.1 xanthine dehydrogenase family protein molybdopterin-binding subunit [Gemmatimonadota bacterium]
PGVVGTVTLGYGVGVVAETVEEAFAARDAMEIEWGAAQADGFDSVASLAAYAGIADGESQGRPLSESGDVRAAMDGAATRYEADYFNDYVYHAQMEPLSAVASVNPAGDGAEVWAGTQAPDMARAAVARELGVPVEQVTFHPCYLGGGLGRRTMADYIVEAVQLSRSVRRPVKLIWTREDDLQYGAFRPMSLQRLTGGVDAGGNLAAWTHTVVGDGRGLLASGIGIQYYDIPNQRIEMRTASHGVRTKHWRAVGHGPNKFAIESFIDDIARGEGIDPVELRRRLLRGSPRGIAVLDLVAEMADWGRAPPGGRARGVAFVERSGTLAAGVAEVSLEEDTGRIRVHRFWCAADGGVVVQPRNARAQIEGGIVNGLSTALFERLTVRDGRVEQSNFHDYSILRMSDMPDIEVRFIDSNEAPMGLGEPGVPVAAAAVANAFAALTGRPLRHMPFTADRVLEALNG